MKRVFGVFLFTNFLVSCSKPCTLPTENMGAEKVVAYFGLEGTFVYRDSLHRTNNNTTYVDTLERSFISAGYSGDYYVVHYKDSMYSSGTVEEDSFKISGDTLYSYIFPDYILAIKPLSEGMRWYPLRPATYPYGDVDTINLSSCTVSVYYDSVRVDSSGAIVLSPNSSVFPLFYKNIFRIYIHTTVSNCPFGPLDTTTYWITEDTMYIKPYYGMVRFTRNFYVQTPISRSIVLKDTIYLLYELKYKY